MIFLRLIIASAIWFAPFITLSYAQFTDWKHGDSLIGQLKYPPGFAHYDHVNSKAPKTGRFNQTVRGGFDSLNPFIVRGRPAAGLNYTGGLLWDTLFEQSVDQSSTAYGLVAEAFRYNADYSIAIYRLNPKAHFHDGSPITPEDVIWSLDVLRANQPLYASYYKNVKSAKKTGEREVTFTFDISGNRELPHIMGDLPVLPKHWWEAKDANGNKRDISQPSLEIPLGSGPYKIKEFSAGNSITWERVKNYWAKNLNVRVGRYNFDQIHYTYFKDRSAMWEAFKKGGLEDLWRENRSQRWATEYVFPTFKNGDVLRKQFVTQGSQVHQAFYFNTRKSKFQDRLLRQALTLLFDFETMNKNLFYGLYKRTDSYFEGGELQAQGKPEGRELEILNEYKSKLPPDLFTKAFKLPVINGPADTRKTQRRAIKLLRQAGYKFSNNKMLDKSGNPFEIEFLGKDTTDERITGPYIENLRKLGINAHLRIVDSAQYKSRLDNFDFDITTALSRQSLSPGNEQREYWTTSAANKPGTRNYAGIHDPVVDDLVERIIAAKDRSELVALTKALDRVLLWGFYSIPHWYNPNLWYAWWRKIQIPENQPKHIGLDIWSLWIDKDIDAGIQK